MKVAMEKLFGHPPKLRGLKNNTAQFHTGLVRRLVLALSVPKVLTSTKVCLAKQMSLKGPLRPHWRKGSKPHHEGCTFCSGLCPECRLHGTSFGKLYSRLVDGGTREHFRALHRISSEGRGQNLLFSTLGDICPWKCCWENANIQDNPNAVTFLAPDNIKKKKNKLKGKLILFLIKIFLSLLYKFLLSGFYVLVIFKITSGSNLLHK